MDGVDRAQPGDRRGAQEDRSFDRGGADRDGSGGRFTRSAGAARDDGRVEAVAGMRRPARAGSAEAGASGLLQWLEPRAARREVRDTGEYGEDVAAPQHAGYPGMPRTLGFGLLGSDFRSFWPV